MKIEIAEPGRMTQSGSSLIRLIQNNSMPALDLLVRESIQNSLDARKPDARYVSVEFVTGQFKSDLLGKELEKLTTPINDKFGSNKYQYIAIKDSCTVGLTGEMNYRDVKENKYGNLLKLVYEICKPQQAEGAGGSWGIGKTVYFRIGIGLVIYYSRILDENGKYKSRLVASFVENENSSDAMIPSYNGMSKRGIAWWGKKVKGQDNETEPVTDEEYIADFLSIFSIKPYEGDKTGTVIIIPYINSEELLLNNSIEYLDECENKVTPFWSHKLEDYLSIAVQRWYAPRLNNKYYDKGAYLQVSINGNRLTEKKMEPVFRVIQFLYNKALPCDDEYFNDIQKDEVLSKINDDSCFCERIKINKVLNQTFCGYLSCAKVSHDVLHMAPPYNKPAPEMYFNIENKQSDKNQPIICFTRKPAMVVSYENDGPWVSKIMPQTNLGEYIVGIFVLNSDDSLKLKDDSMTLEEYIRLSERADHSSWSDSGNSKCNPVIVKKIQKHVNDYVRNHFSPDKEQKDITKVNSGFGKLFGDLLLPPEGFGKNSSAGLHDNRSNNNGSVHRRNFFVIDGANTKYHANEMIIPMFLESTSKRKLKSSSFDILIDTESKKISINEWENDMKMEAPFSISRYELIIDTVGSEQVNITKSFNAAEQFEIHGITFSGKITRNGTCHGLNVSSEKPIDVKMRIRVTVDLRSKDVKPAFVYE